MSMNDLFRMDASHSFFDDGYEPTMYDFDDMLLMASYDHDGVLTKDRTGPSFEADTINVFTESMKSTLRTCTNTTDNGGFVGPQCGETMVVIAGGWIASDLIGFKGAMDVDHFFIGGNRESKACSLEGILRRVKFNTMVRSPLAITTSCRELEHPQQFIFAKADTIQELLSDFDIDSACFATDGKSLYALRRGLDSFYNGRVFLFRPELISKTYVKRVFKYIIRKECTLGISKEYLPSMLCITDTYLDNRKDRAYRLMRIMSERHGMKPWNIYDGESIYAGKSEGIGELYHCRGINTIIADNVKSCMKAKSSPRFVIGDSKEIDGLLDGTHSKRMRTMIDDAEGRITSEIQLRLKMSMGEWFERALNEEGRSGEYTIESMVGAVHGPIIEEFKDLDLGYVQFTKTLGDMREESKEGIDPSIYKDWFGILKSPKYMGAMTAGLCLGEVRGVDMDARKWLSQRIYHYLIWLFN